MSLFFAILGRTDLRIGVSKAKFDAEADFEVHLPPAFPKSYEQIEKLRKMSGIFFSIFFNFFFDDFFFAESIRMYPNVSECVKTDPNRSENVEKRRKTSRKLVIQNMVFRSMRFQGQNLVHWQGFFGAWKSAAASE